MFPIDVRVIKPISIKQGTILTIEDDKLKFINKKNPYNFFLKNLEPSMVPLENQEEFKEIVENINDLNNERKISYKNAFQTINSEIKRIKSLNSETKSKSTQHWSKLKSFASGKSFPNRESLKFIHDIYLYNKIQLDTNLPTVSNDSFIKNDLVEFDQNKYGRIYNIIIINDFILALIKRNHSIDTNLKDIMKDIEFSVEINSENFQGIIVKLESLKKFNQPLKFKAGTSFIEPSSIKFKENYDSNKFQIYDIIRFNNRRKFQYAEVVGSYLINNTRCLEILLVYPLDEEYNAKRIIQENKEIRIFDKELDVTYYENVIINPNPILKVEEIENETFKIDDSIKFSLMYSLNTFYGIIKWIGKINDIPITIVHLEDNLISEMERDYKIDDKCCIYFKNLEYEDDKKLFVIPICFLMKAELKQNNVNSSDTHVSEKNVERTHLICLKDNVILIKDDICEFSLGDLWAINNQNISLDNAIFSNCRKLSEIEYNLVSPLKSKKRIKKMDTVVVDSQNEQKNKSNKTKITKTKGFQENLKMESICLLVTNKLENFKFDFSETEFKKDKLLIITWGENEIYGRFHCFAKYRKDEFVCVKSIKDLEITLMKLNIRCSFVIFKNNPILNDFEGIIIKKETVRKFDYELRFLKELPIVDESTEKYSEINSNSKFKVNDLIKYVDKDNIYYARVVCASLINEICCLDITWIFPKEETDSVKESAMIKITNIKHEIKYYGGTIMAPNPVLVIEIMKTNFNIGDEVKFFFKYTLTEYKGIIEWTGKLNEIPCAVLNLNILEEDNIISKIERDYKIDDKCSKKFETLKYEDNKQLFVIPICFLMKIEPKKNNIRNLNTFYSEENRIMINTISSDT